MEIISAPLEVLLSKEGFNECVRDYGWTGGIREFGKPIEPPYDFTYLKNLEYQGILSCFGLVEGVTIKGFCSYIKMYLAHRQGHIATMESLYVAPDVRGKRWGARLIKTAMVHAKANGCKTFMVGLPYGRDKFLDFKPINTVFAHEL